MAMPTCQHLWNVYCYVNTNILQTQLKLTKSYPNYLGSVHEFRPAIPLCLAYIFRQIISIHVFLHYFNGLPLLTPATCTLSLLTDAVIGPTHPCILII